MRNIAIRIAAAVSLALIAGLVGAVGLTIMPEYEGWGTFGGKVASILRLTGGIACLGTAACAGVLSVGALFDPTFPKWGED